MASKPPFRLSSSLLLLCSLFISLIATPLQAADAQRSMSFSEVLGKVVQGYPNLQSAILQVERSILELDRIYATLGWFANADTYASHDVGSLGTPQDILQARGGLSRKLKSGDRISIDASYMRSDNDLIVTPILPNPSNDSAVNLSYRRPLQKGSGNIEYHAAMQAAQAQIRVSQAEENQLRDLLAEQVAELYFGLATTEVNLKNVREGIDRLRRLHRFVLDNEKLGVSEEKDILQSQARLDRKRAELSALQTARNQQIYNLNRLMNIPADSRYQTAVDYQPVELPARELLRDEIFSYNPDMNRARASRQVAESNIAVQRDAKKDVVDVILSVGARAKSGPSENADIDETDLAGKVGLEYRAALDKTGLRAALQQSLLSRDIADNQIRQLDIDLNNDLDRLLGLVRDQQQAIASNQRLLQAEKSKFDEAVSRFRSGRTTTESLILFEEDLSLAEFAVATSKVELIKSLNEMSRLRGAIWQALK